MMRRRSYGIAAAAIFMTEVVIAACIHDDFVRPHVGDSLAVLLVYCVLRAVTPLTISASITASLLLACAIEFGQLYGLLSMLGLQDFPLARTVLGTGYDPKDFIAYAAGGAIAWIAERIARQSPHSGTGW